MESGSGEKCEASKLDVSPPNLITQGVSPRRYVVLAHPFNTTFVAATCKQDESQATLA